MTTMMMINDDNDKGQQEQAGEGERDVEMM